MTDKMVIAKWLEMKFIDWQKQEGGRRSVREFGLYLGIPQSTLNNYLRGARAPSGDHVHRIAEKLGSEIYELLGFVGDQQHELLALLDLLWHLDAEDIRWLLQEARKRAGIKDER